jgi:hypothetical protein
MGARHLNWVLTGPSSAVRSNQRPPCQLHVIFREMENISRGPTFGDFITIRTEATMQDVTVAKLQEYKSKDSPLPLLKGTVA